MNQARAPLFAAARWRELRESVDRLDALAAADREAELDRIAATDPELAQTLRALVASGPMPAPLSLHAAEPARDAVPQRIGPFRPLREIGAGGMGVVYLAQRQDADFTQRVALKLLDGGASRLSRLAVRERNILATLAHPNITAFVDAGTTGDGRAWLAMEYVDGEPLVDYCERRQSDTRERVRLFVQVCAAVAHAHAQLVVHRDLKPSNVLVNRDGTVKLLDFGIAQVIDPSDVTTPATKVFTPEYAAPEQLRGERATTATDVYALGLLLFELICGRRLPTASHSEEWTAAELARIAMTRTGDEPGATAGGRISTRLLRGDLGRIVTHALQPDPARRYASVASLSEDLRRWLDHRPLGIGRHSLAYMAARFARRHRAAVAIAALAIVALIATTGFALWQARTARHMAARADQARMFLAGLFTDANPYAPGHTGKDVASLMEAAARRIDAEFADDPDMQAQLRAMIGEALLRLDQPGKAYDLDRRTVEQMRRVHGTHAPQVGAALGQLALASEENGDIDGARARYNEAYALLQNAGPTWTRDRISVMTGLAKMAGTRDDYAEEQRWHETVLREREAAEGPRSADIAMDLMNLSADAQAREHFADSEELAMRAHAMLEQVLGPGHPRSIYVDNALGSAQVRAGHCVAAITTLRNAVAVARSRLPPGAPMLGINLSNLGQAQACAGDDAASIATLRDARDILVAAHSPALGTLELRLGLVELHARSAQALQTLDSSRTALAATALRYAGAAENALWAQAAYADALAIHGDAAGAEPLAREARTRLQSGKNSGSVILGEIDLLLADVLDRKPASAEALVLRKEALSAFVRVYGADHPKTRALAAQLGTATAG